MGAVCHFAMLQWCYVSFVALVLPGTLLLCISDVCHFVMFQISSVPVSFCHGACLSLLIMSCLSLLIMSCLSLLIMSCLSLLIMSCLIGVPVTFPSLMAVKPVFIITVFEFMLILIDFAVCLFRFFSFDLLPLVLVCFCRLVSLQFLS